MRAPQARAGLLKTGLGVRHKNIRTYSGWMLLAAVLDLNSWKLRTWAVSPEVPGALVREALQMALAQRNPLCGSYRALQPGSAVRQWCASVTADKTWFDKQHEPQRCLLRKLGDGALFFSLKAERVW